MSTASAPSPPDETVPEVSVVLPCYNERNHVEQEIKRIRAALEAAGMSYELICVDDGSTDGTREVLASIPAIRTILFPRNQGSGTARRIGTQEARGRVVVWTDADMTYPNELIPDLVRQLDDGYDQVVGARKTEAGTYKFFRVPAKWAIRRLAAYLTNTPIPDLNSGLRAFKRDVAKPYLRLLPPGFSCVTTITLAFLSNGHQIKYVPIDYFKRAGRSKFHPFKDAYNYIIQVLRMVMYFNPLRVLMPVALTLLGGTFVKLVWDLVVHPFRVATNTVLLGVTGLVIACLALLADLVVRRTAID
ncbi:MAG TPA: glycosyltransferase family 2 protein [Candidatus Binatia bacterium]|nr:glycosyltransferase family 2 protein [Candidatus Binatia bacterium]